MKCEKCGNTLNRFGDKDFVCQSAGCEWQEWVLKEEMAALLASSSAAFEQYKQSIAVVTSVNRSLSDDLCYLTSMCRLLEGGYFIEGVPLTSFHADLINDVVKFVAIHDRR